MDELKAILANNLEVLMRESADLHTQSALAKRAHVAQTTIGRRLRAEIAKTSPQ